MYMNGSYLQYLQKLDPVKGEIDIGWEGVGWA